MLHLLTASYSRSVDIFGVSREKTNTSNNLIDVPKMGNEEEIVELGRVDNIDKQN